MNKRIYNGVSGVLPADKALRDANAAAWKAMFAAMTSWGKARVKAGIQLEKRQREGKIQLC